MDIRLLGERTTSLRPNLFTVVEKDVGEGSRDRSERETVGHGEGYGNEQGTVRPVSLEVKGGVFVNNACDIVGLASVVEGLIRNQGQEARVPDISVLRETILEKELKGRNETHVKNGDEEPVEKDDSGTDVSSRPPRDRKRRTVEGDLTPVKGEDAHGQAVANAEQLVDFAVVRRDPANPREAG